MQEFDSLIEVLEQLLGPGGCPWDREQTLASMRTSVLEEVHEAIEAIDLRNPEKICEELGDLFFSVCFLCKMAEKEAFGTTEEILSGIAEKLVRRHPHVFGDVEVSDTDAVLAQWDRIKSEERGSSAPPSVDDLPPTLPALVKAQKLLRRLDKSGFGGLYHDVEPFASEEELGQELFKIAARARASKLDAETALGKTLALVKEQVQGAE